MVHKLALVALIGLTGSAACIGAAAAIGGKDFGGSFRDFSLFDGRPSCAAVAGATATSRDMDWDGSDHVGMSLLGQANYTPGSDQKLHATGDAQVLAHLRIRHGNVELDCHGWQDRTRDLVITLPGREFAKYAAVGGTMALTHLNQPSAEIAIAGSGTVKANGNVDDLKVSIGGSGKADLDQITAHQAKVSIGGAGTVRANGKIDDVKIEIGGSGRADFGQVASRTAKVSIGGSGNADIAPSEDAKIEIGGSGDVTLHSDPKQMDTEIGGSGHIHKAAS